VESDDGNPVLVVFQDKYSKVGVEHERALQKMLGDTFASCFNKSMEIKVKGHVSRAMLRDTLGEKAYLMLESMTDITEHLSITGNFMERRAMLHASADKKTNEAIDEIVGQVQYSPQVKLS
jgi:hypothetical protein